MGRTSLAVLAAVAVAATQAACGDDDEPTADRGAEGTATTAGGGAGADTAAEGTSGDGGGGQQGFRAELEPLNGSGVGGTALFSQLGQTLRVQITADGLAPDEQHAQHIHRRDDGAPGECPTEVQDENGDGIISDREGQPVYGGVAIELAPFPAARHDGAISFQGTFDVDPGLEPLTDRVVVLHGLELDGQYDATVPVACGRIG